MTQSRYQVISLLGKGAFGEVVRANLDGPMGFKKMVAIKRIHPHLVQENEKFVRSLVNEARLGGLLKHPNVVETYEFSQAGGTWYIAMEYVPGFTLEDLVNRCKKTGAKLPLSLVLEIGVQTCAGLYYAHALQDEEGENLGIIHRDLKPANLMVNTNGAVKIMDFGIAKAASNLYHTTQEGATKGTPAYMSPEQVHGSVELTPRSDLFAVGAILYELLTGERLFHGENTVALLFAVASQNSAEKVEPLNDLLPGLGDVLQKALEKKPDNRYQDANEFGKALRELLNAASGSETLHDLAQHLTAKEAKELGESSAEFQEFIDAFYEDTGKAWDPLKEKKVDGQLSGWVTSPPQGTQSIEASSATATQLAVPTGQHERSWRALIILGVLMMLFVMGAVTWLVMRDLQKEDPQPQIIREVVVPAEPAPTPKPVVKEPEPVAKDPPVVVKRPDPEPEPTPETVYEGTGTLKVKSSPWAWIEIDGKRVAKTPFRESIPAGKHTIKIICGECQDDQSRLFRITLETDEEEKIQTDFEYVSD